MWKLHRVLPLIFGSIGTFVHGIMLKWYLIIAVPAIMVTYWVFHGLHTSGVLSKATNVIASGLRDTQAIAQHCVPKIAHLEDMWRCIEHPPAYVPHHNEEALKREIERALKLKKIADEDDLLSNGVRDPYMDSDD